MSDYSHRYLVPTYNGLVAQIGLSTGVSVVCIGIFEWNRRKKTLQYLYSPRCRLKVNPSPPMSLKFLGWIKPTMNIPEEFYIANVGLDAVMFLRFLKMCLQFCIFNSVILGIILLPIHFTGGNGLSELPRMSIANVADNSNVLWAHVILTYMVSVSWMFLLLKNYWQWMDLRREYTLQRIRQGEVAERSVFVSRLPSHLRTDSDLKEYFESLKMGPVDCATVVQHCGRLSQKIDRRESTLNLLEKAHIELAQTVLEKIKQGKFSLPSMEKSTAGPQRSFLASPAADEISRAQDVDHPSLDSMVQNLYQDKKWYQKIRKSIFAHKREPKFNRPHLNIPLSALAHHSDIIDVYVNGGKEMEKTGSVTSLCPPQYTIWNALTELDRSTMDEYQPTRPANRFKNSERITSIDYLVRKYNRLDRKVAELRDGTLRYKATPFGFVTFKHHLSAQLCAQAKIDSRPQGISVRLAMEPRDVLWSNLTASFRNRFTRSVVVNLSIWALIIFWIFPTSSFLLLTSLGALSARFKFLAPILEASSLMQSLVQNVLPIVFVTIFLALAPVIILEISKQELPASHSALEGKVFRRYYHFLIFNVLFVFMIGTTILKSIITLIQQPTNIFTLLAESLPLGSTFFIFYIVFNTCGHALELVQVWAQLFIHGFVTSAKLTPTPRSLQRATAPWNFQYYYYYPHNILVIVITFIYSTISPLILFASVFYFAFAVLVFKYQLAYCYIRKFETSGKFFRHVFQYTTDGLIIFQITMAGELWLKNAPIAGFCVVTLIGFTIYFKILCADLFKSRTKFLPLDTGLRNFDNSSTYTLNDPPGLNNDFTSAFSSAVMKPDQNQGLRHRNLAENDRDSTSTRSSTSSSDDSGLNSPIENKIFMTPVIDIQAASPVIDSNNEMSKFASMTNSSPKSSTATAVSSEDHLDEDGNEKRSSKGSTVTGYDMGLAHDLQSANGGSSRSSVVSKTNAKESESRSRHSSIQEIKLFTVGDNPMDGPQGYDESKMLRVNQGGASQIGELPRGSVFYLDSEYTQSSVVIRYAPHFEHAPSKIVHQDCTSNFETYVHPALLKPLNRKLWLPRNPLYTHWDLDDTVEVDFTLNSSASSNKLGLRNRDREDHHQNQQASRVGSEHCNQPYTQRRNTVSSNNDNGAGVLYHTIGYKQGLSAKDHISGVDGSQLEKNDELLSQYDNPVVETQFSSSIYLASKNNSRTQLSDHIVMGGDKKDIIASEVIHSGSVASVNKFMPSSPPEGGLLSPTHLSEFPINTRCKRSASMPPAPPTAGELAIIQRTNTRGNDSTHAGSPTGVNPRQPFISGAATIRSISPGYQSQQSGSAGHSPRIAFIKDTTSPLNVRSTMFARARGHRHTISNGQGNSIHQGPPGQFSLSRDDTYLGLTASSPNANAVGATSGTSPVMSASGTSPTSQSRRGAVLQTAGAFFSMIFGDGDDDILDANENPQFGYETGGMWSSRRGNSGRDADFDEDDEDEDDNDSSINEEITMMTEVPYTTINIMDFENFER